MAIDVITGSSQKGRRGLRRDQRELSVRDAQLNDIPITRALLFPALLTALMIVLAAAISWSTGVDGSKVFPPYFLSWSVLGIMSVPVWALVKVAKMAAMNADEPTREILRDLSRPIQLSFLSGVIFPIFLGGYTWAKYSIALTVGFKWERIWADADYFIFGTDAWVVAHTIIPPWLAHYLTYFYAVVWGLVFVFSGVLVAAFSTKRFAATFFTSMMLSWLFGGIILAYSISAAGPVFANLVDPSIGLRFEPLRAELHRILPADDMVLRTQRYLASGLGSQVALKGGGISAMPSMHVATATVLVLAAWKTRWLLFALVFLLLTFIGSIYLGYHYAVDAPVASLVAIISWLTARRVFQAPSEIIGYEVVATLNRRLIS